MTNKQRLIVERTSQLFVDDSSTFCDIIGQMVKPGGIEARAKQATEWVEAAIAAVKTAPGSLYVDDEEIAAEILRQAKAKRSQFLGVLKGSPEID